MEFVSGGDDEVNYVSCNSQTNLYGCSGNGSGGDSNWVNCDPGNSDGDTNWVACSNGDPWNDPTPNDRNLANCNTNMMFCS